MSDNLHNCPFCGGNNTRIDENKYRSGETVTILDVTLKHWCTRQGGTIQDLITLHARTRQDVISKWHGDNIK